MYQHLFISLGWFIAVMAAAVLGISVILFLSDVALNAWADHRWARYQRKNKIVLQSALRKRSR
jgi:hypothetical protein